MRYTIQPKVIIEFCSSFMILFCDKLRLFLVPWLGLWGYECTHAHTHVRARTHTRTYASMQAFELKTTSADAEQLNDSGENIIVGGANRCVLSLYLKKCQSSERKKVAIPPQISFLNCSIIFQCLTYKKEKKKTPQICFWKCSKSLLPMSH